MYVTRQQTKAFLKAMLGGDESFLDGPTVYWSPRVRAFLDGALPNHGAPDWFYLFQDASQSKSKPLSDAAQERLDEFVDFLEGVTHCLRDPEAGKHSLR